MSGVVCVCVSLFVSPLSDNSGLFQGLANTAMHIYIRVSVYV